MRRIALIAGTLMALHSTPARSDDAQVLEAAPDAVRIDPDAAIATLEARITFYTLSGLMYSGLTTRPGAAACSWDLDIGTRVRFSDGRVVTCLDRGLLGNGRPRSWVDVYSETLAWGRANVARAYGDITTVEVLAA